MVGRENVQHVDSDAGWGLRRRDPSLNLDRKTQTHRHVQLSERDSAMLDRLMHHGYGVHHVVPGRRGEEQHWACGLSLDAMDCWQRQVGVDAMVIGR